MIENVMTLAMLVLLQAVLGFDNLLYISLESRRAPAESRGMVQRLGIGIAIVLRIGLLFLLVHLVQRLRSAVFSIDTAWLSVAPSVHSVIVLAGGVFIIYTAVKEIFHMMRIEVEHHDDKKPASVPAIVTMIVLMNVVFSFDSILSAMALTHTFWVMALAIVIGGVLMIWLTERVTNFLQKNRVYEVLGLFILFIVGVMLLSEGGHLAHLELFGHEVTQMSKATFYFVIAVLVLIDIVQTQYQKKLLHEKAPAGGATENFD